MCLVDFEGGGERRQHGRTSEDGLVFSVKHYMQDKMGPIQRQLVGVERKETERYNRHSTVDQRRALAAASATALSSLGTSAGRLRPA